jgi:hyaluronan synthase
MWLDWSLRGFSAIYLLLVLAAILYYRVTATRVFERDPVLAIYGAVVGVYLLTRFALSLLYRPYEDVGIEPRVAIVQPAFNEEEDIAESMSSLLTVDYPLEKLEIVAVNDGSTDGTLGEIEKVAAQSGGRVQVIDFPENRGKRAAMAAGIRATTAEVIAVVDSDSMLEKDSLRKLVQAFADERVGAVSGHTDVANADENWVTKMQAVRYYISFRVLKAAEAYFGCVTCCPGCFSAYRRSAIEPHLDWWEHQHFLGVTSTFGDDRSLTNCVLRDWRVGYQVDARARTVVPVRLRQFIRQQARWKRSWAREATILVRLIWRKPVPASAAVYVSVMLPLAAPLVAARSLFIHPLLVGSFSILYPLGVYAMALTYGLYYAACQPRFGSRWWYGIVFVGFYLAFLLWQTYWAIATLRTAKWGTRPATAGITSKRAAAAPAEIVTAAGSERAADAVLWPEPDDAPEYGAAQVAVELGVEVEPRRITRSRGQGATNAAEVRR